MKPKKRRRLECREIWNYKDYEYNQRAESLFVKKYICSHKGCGLFAAADIEQDTFILEYRGKCVSIQEGEFELNEQGPSFIFFLKKHCIIGDQDDLCSSANDNSKYFNSVMKVLPGTNDRIGLFSLKNSPIVQGEEITYSYGPGYDKMPWRRMEALSYHFKKEPNIPSALDSAKFCNYCKKEALANKRIDKDGFTKETVMEDETSVSNQNENKVEFMDGYLYREKENQVEIDLGKNECEEKNVLVSAQQISTDELIFINGNYVDEEILIEKEINVDFTPAKEKHEDKVADFVELCNHCTNETPVNKIIDEGGFAKETAMTDETFVSNQNENKVEYMDGYIYREKENRVEITPGENECEDKDVLISAQQMCTNELISIKGNYVDEEILIEDEMNVDFTPTKYEDNVVDFVELRNLCSNKTAENQRVDKNGFAKETYRKHGTFVSNHNGTKVEYMDGYIYREKESYVEITPGKKEYEDKDVLVSAQQICTDELMFINGNYVDEEILIENEMNEDFTPAKEKPVDKEEIIKHNSVDLQQISLVPYELTSDEECDQDLKMIASDECFNKVSEKSKEDQEKSFSLTETTRNSDNMDDINIVNMSEVSADNGSSGLTTVKMDIEMLEKGFVVSNRNIYYSDLDCMLKSIENGNEASTSLDFMSTNVHVSQLPVMGVNNNNSRFAVNMQQINVLEHTADTDVQVGEAIHPGSSLNTVADLQFDNGIDNNITVSDIQSNSGASCDNAKNSPSVDTKRKGERKCSERYERPCPYCNKNIKHFAEHLQSKHSKEKNVEDILNCKNTALRKRKYRVLMIKGIQKYNDNVIGTKEPLMRLKKTSKPQRLGYQCINCLMYYTASTISRHKRHCYVRDGKEMPGRGKGILVSTSSPIDRSLSFLDPEFIEDVVERMHSGRIKSDIQQDLELIYIGNEYYLKIKTNRTNKRNPSSRTRKLLRCLSNFKIKFNNSRLNRKQESKMLSHILSVKNWSKIKMTINNIIYREEESGQKALKVGSAVQLRDALTIAGKHLRSFYTLYNNDEVYSSVKKSLVEFNLEYDNIKGTAFGSIGEINLERRAYNRGAERLPTKAEVKKVIDSCTAVVQKMPDVPNEKSYISVRRSVVTRLIFFNGRRPAEVSNLKIIQWKLAKENFYLTSEQRAELCKERESPINEFRVIVTVGKSKDVPCIIPKCLWEAMDFLADEHIRRKSNVHHSNYFMFPSTRQSLLPSDGPDNIRNITEKIEGVDISSVKVRRLVANAFAATDFPENWRKEVFEFLGHSGAINKIHYCMPDVKKVYQLIAPVLDKLDAKYEDEFDEHFWDSNIESGGSITQMFSSQEPIVEFKTPTKMPSTSSVYQFGDHSSNSDITRESSTKQMSPRSQEPIVEFQTPTKLPSISSFYRLQGDKGILENDTERQLAIPVQMSPASSIYASSPATSLFESYDSDTSEDEKEFKRGKRLRWKKEHNDIITEEFFGFLSGQKEYPSKEDLNKFFHAYPDILSDFSVKEKYDKIRVKLNNSKRIIKMNKKIHEIKIKKV